MKLSIIIMVTIFLASCNNSKKRRDNAGSFQDNTDIKVTWDTTSYILNSSNASIFDNNIELSFDGNYANEGFYFSIQNQGNQWIILEPVRQISPTDCLYVSSRFKILNQSLKINEDEVRRRDKIHGSLNLLMLGRKAFVREPEIPFIDNRKWDTIHIYGTFATQIN